MFMKDTVYLKTKFFLYGGNLGKPQGIDFLINVIDNFENWKISSY